MLLPIHLNLNNSFWNTKTMQVQIKKQLKIELDQADVTLAIRNFLATNGYTISEAELEKINYVKSPRDGLRAELNITEESGVETETQAVVTTAVEAAKEHIAEIGLAVVETEDPGEVATPSVEDVAVNEAVERALVPEVETEDEVEPATAAVAVEPSAEEPPRTKLFM